MRPSPPEAGCGAPLQRWHLQPAPQPGAVPGRPGHLRLRLRLRAVSLASGVLWGPLALAQTANLATTQPRSLAVQPSASITQTFTDNFLLSGVDPTADAITRLSAAVSLKSQTGLVRGFLDYSLSSLVHARHSDRNTLQSALNMVLGADVIDGRARIDVTGTIAQSAVSAFGVQPVTGSGVQSNSTETRNLRITPSVRGPLGADYRYSGQLGYAITDAKGVSLGNSSTSSAALHLEPTSRGLLGWALDGSLLRSDYKAGRATSDDRLYGTANLRIPAVDLLLQANGGVEVSDITAASRQSYGNWGLGATWAPSPRTRLVADFNHRFYGPSRSLSFEHRTALTTWRLTDSRSLSTDNGQLTDSGRGTAFDLFYAQAASAVPDPVRRVDYVNALLQALGISPTAEPGFLRSSVTLQQRQELSVALRGVRSAAVVSVTRSLTQRLGAQPGVTDDLSATSEVRLHGLSVNLSHRLTPMSTATALLSQSQGTGVGAAQHTKQRLLSLQYTNRPGNNSDLSLGLRRAAYQQFSASFGESAIFATYGVRF